MPIGNHYKLESDSLNVTVYRWVKSKGGGKWRAVAYFGTVKGALTYLVDLEVRETGLRDLRTVVKKQEQIYELIRSLNLPRPGKSDPDNRHQKASKSAQRHVWGRETAGGWGEKHRSGVLSTPKTAAAKAERGPEDSTLPEQIQSLAAKGWRSRAIAGYLKQQGIPVSYRTVERVLSGGRGQLELPLSGDGP